MGLRRGVRGLGRVSGSALACQMALHTQLWRLAGGMRSPLPASWLALTVLAPTTVESSVVTCRQRSSTNEGSTEAAGSAVSLWFWLQQEVHSLQHVGCGSQNITSGVGCLEKECLQQLRRQQQWQPAKQRSSVHSRRLSGQQLRWIGWLQWSCTKPACCVWPPCAAAQVALYIEPQSLPSCTPPSSSSILYAVTSLPSTTALCGRSRTRTPCFNMSRLPLPIGPSPSMPPASLPPLLQAVPSDCGWQGGGYHRAGRGEGIEGRLSNSSSVGNGKQQQSRPSSDEETGGAARGTAGNGGHNVSSCTWCMCAGAVAVISMNSSQRIRHVLGVRCGSMLATNPTYA